MTTAPTRILLAEDSENDKELTLAAFADCGLTSEVDWVRDGQEALDYLLGVGADPERAMPVVVLLDLKMPRVDGIQVLERIKQHAELRSIPVVMLTSSREEQDISRSYQLGVNAYVVKPVAFHDFARVLREVGVFWGLVNRVPGQSTRA